MRPATPRTASCPRAVRARSLDEVSRGALGGIRVLVVDDDPEMRAAVQGALEAVGAEVVAVASADEALDALERSHPDLLLSDLGMPGRDGCALMRAVRALPPERGGAVRAVALTAFADRDVGRRTIDAGFQAHVVKPIEAAALIDIVSGLAASDA
ncbi:MAG TPA: response regulator [Candidatus Binatia bacterium]|nr:response regulator [Candidatus Binatia bacterium]